jgi:hypothetical protein
MSLRPSPPSCAHARHGWHKRTVVRRFRLTVGTQRYTAALLRKQTFLRAAFVSRPRPNRQTEAWVRTSVHRVSNWVDFLCHKNQQQPKQVALVQFGK